MGLMKNILVGGIAGALHGRHEAENRWDAKRSKMYDELGSDGQPIFHRRLNGDWGVRPKSEYWNPFWTTKGDWPMTLQGIEKWEGMGRQHVWEGTKQGAGMRALLAGAGTYFLKGQGSRRREVPPPYMPHPRVAGLGIPGAMAAPAA